MVGLGLLASLILILPLAAARLFAGTLLVGRGLGEFVLRAGALTAPFRLVLGLLVGAISGFGALVFGAEAGTGFLVGADRPFGGAFEAPTGLEPWLLTCLVAAAEGFGCADEGKTFRDAFVTMVPGADASGRPFMPYGFVASLGSRFAFCEALAPTYPSAANLLRMPSP